MFRTLNTLNIESRVSRMALSKLVVVRIRVSKTFQNSVIKSIELIGPSREKIGLRPDLLIERFGVAPTPTPLPPSTDRL